MSKIDNALRNILIGDVIESLIKFSLIAILVALCARYFAPFTELMVWGIVLAIAISPIHQSWAKKMGSSWSATLITILLLLLIAVPVTLLSLALTSHIQELKALASSGNFTIQAPPASVADWPIIGDKIYPLWQQAATDLHQFIANNIDVVKSFAHKALNIISGLAGSIFSMIGAMVIAGIMLAYTASANASFEKIFKRIISPSKGPQIKSLCIGTVRSVAVGVIGVAFIQALIIGSLLYFAHIPGAGILTLILFFAGIIQLPALLITLPVIIYLWSGNYEGNAIVWSILLFIGGLSDNVLKPLLLGRGVEAPMIVILIGALGGMIQGGLLGLFVGAVILAVGYQLFMLWVNQPDSDDQQVNN